MVQAPVNHSPVANSDSASALSQQTINIPVLNNDTDAEGDALIVSGVSGSPNATIIRNNGYVIYSANFGFTGTDTFTYTIQDIYLAQATGTVTVNVGNNLPFQNDKNKSTAYNTALDFDPREGPVDYDGQAVSVISVSQPTGGGGSAQVLSPSLVRFTPAPTFSGTTTFNFTVQDTVGGQYTAQISMMVSPASGLGITVDPTQWIGGRTQGGPSTPDQLHVRVSNGSNSYAYAWTKVSGDPGVTANSANSANTAFYYTGNVTGPRTSYWKCTVTDNVTGQTGETLPIYVEYNYETNQ